MTKALRQAAALVAIACLPALVEAVCLRDRIAWSAPRSGEEVSVQEARRSGGNVMWLDARPEAEFAAAHVPGALLLNTERWDELLPSVLNAWSPGRKIVVYCSKQTCGASKEVARRLREEAGLKDVFVLSGGWEAWQASSK